MELHRANHRTGHGLSLNSLVFPQTDCYQQNRYEAYRLYRQVSISILGLFLSDYNNIPVHITCLLAEPIQRIRNKIPLFINLPQRLLGTSIQLKLKNINGIFRLHHGIGTTSGTTDFRLNKLPHQSENHIKNSLIMTFGIIT